MRLKLRLLGVFPTGVSRVMIGDGEGRPPRPLRRISLPRRLSHEHRHATALHAQTLLTLTYADETLPAKYGYPLKLRIPTKLGYKNPKYIQEVFVTNINPGGFWEDQGYNWFGGS